MDGLESTYLTPSSHLTTTPQTPPTTVSQQQTPRAVAQKCFDLCREWFIILYTNYGMIVTQSDAGEKILKNLIISPFILLVFFGLEVIYVYRVYKTLLVGPKLPQMEMRQVRFILTCCGICTALIVGMTTVGLPLSMLQGDEDGDLSDEDVSPEKWFVSVGVIWSAFWGSIWFVPMFAQTSYALSVSSMPF